MKRLINRILGRERRGSVGQSHGFSLIELLLAAVIATSGMYASLSLCMTALRGNTEMRDLSIAMLYSEHVLNTIQSEAVTWQTLPSAMVRSRFLRNLPEPPAPGQTTGWMTLRVDPFATDRRMGDMGDDAHTYDQGLLFSLPSEMRPCYCGQFRLTWVTSDLVRAEVRVAFSRPHVPVDKYIGCPDAMFDDIGNVLSVNLPGMVMKNVYAQ